MTQEQHHRGICDTCIYRSGCLSLENSIKEGKPILQCEQFEDSKSIQEGEGRRNLVSTFAIVRRFSIKNLIPGWQS